MGLTRYGLREWGLLSLVLLPLAGAGAVMALRSHPAWWALAAVAFILWFAGAAFFRDPWGRTPRTDVQTDMVSPADGKISAVFRAEHHPATDGPAMVVRIFLSVLDVHLNRSPCQGVVDRVTHTPCRYLDACLEESAKVNESNLMVLRTPWGDPVGVRQVSGAIARRIVCPVEPGRRLERGERYGMIKFGSTTELILAHPEKVAVRVKPGDRVVGGVTILASVGGGGGHGRQV